MTKHKRFVATTEHGLTFSINGDPQMDAATLAALASAMEHAYIQIVYPEKRADGWHTNVNSICWPTSHNRAVKLMQTLDTYGIIISAKTHHERVNLTPFKPCYTIQTPALLARDES